MTKTFKVTQSDIDKGQAGQHDSCPVALAMTRTLGKKVFVGQNGISIQNCPEILEIPESVWEFICRFDSGDLISPMSFEMIIPEITLRD